MVLGGPTPSRYIQIQWRFRAIGDIRLPAKLGETSELLRRGAVTHLRTSLHRSCIREFEGRLPVAFSRPVSKFICVAAESKEFISDRYVYAAALGSLFRKKRELTYDEL